VLAAAYHSLRVLVEIFKNQILGIALLHADKPSAAV
jgi:hypothetical protein